MAGNISVHVKSPFLVSLIQQAELGRLFLAVCLETVGYEIGQLPFGLRFENWLAAEFLLATVEEPGVNGIEKAVAMQFELA